jgi:DNA-directed RNA polymerase specialized sigma24 family protein
MVEGAYSRKSEYEAKDILKVAQSAKKFSNARPTYPEETVASFVAHLQAVADRILYDWGAEKPKTPVVKLREPVATVNWPIGVPKDYNGFYRDYRVFVERTLNRYIKPCPSQQIEDVKQHIWLKLVESRTIEKFVEKARFRKIPLKLTATEAVEYLGITWDQWMALMRLDQKWLQPEGNAFSASAVFSRVQVRNVEECGLFPIVDAIPASDMSKVFRGYLTNVIHNHFANYCRTRVRRFIQDTVVPAEHTRVVRSPTSDQYKFTPALEGDSSAWEDALPDISGMRPDEGLDLPDVEGMDELQADLHAQIEEIHKACPGRQEDVLNLIADGCTLREAINQVREQVQERRQAQVG